ncbi:hypothetical protein [Neobacillus sp. Marseille-QA0830]
MQLLERVKLSREFQEVRRKLDGHIQTKLEEIEPELRSHVIDWINETWHQATGNVRENSAAKLQQMQDHFAAQAELVHSELFRIGEDVTLSGFEQGFFQKSNRIHVISAAYSEIDYLFKRIGLSDEEIVKEFRAAAYELFELGFEFGEKHRVQTHLFIGHGPLGDNRESRPTTAADTSAMGQSSIKKRTNQLAKKHEQLQHEFDQKRTELESLITEKQAEIEALERTPDDDRFNGSTAIGLGNVMIINGFIAAFFAMAYTFGETEPQPVQKTLFIIATICIFLFGFFKRKQGKYFKKLAEEKEAAASKRIDELKEEINNIHSKINTYDQKLQEDIQLEENKAQVQWPFE